ncbi:hypothetical protein CPB86DRAFT_780784, partial [Serendipita vermifera]
MFSPKHRMREILRYEGVSEETRAIFMALLRGCENKNRLIAFFLQRVEDYVRTVNPGLHPAILWIHAACPLCQQRGLCGPTGQNTIYLIADALNVEASRWMNDFLIIAIGKRKIQLPTSSSHPLMSPKTPIISHRDAYELQIQRYLSTVERDGPICSVSGAKYNVTCVQLIPPSDDGDRLARFRQLAEVFFQEDMSFLTSNKLQSTENTMMLSMFWKDRLDTGSLVFESIGNEFHAVPWRRRDSDGLAHERRLNGLCGPTLLEIHGGENVNDHPRLDSKLVGLHRKITQTWQMTGLADRLTQEMDWVNSFPKHGQSGSRLDHNTFSRILNHKLTI